MPPQRVRHTDQDKSTSLLSSVFSFVSRELDSFVSNATGRPPREDEDEEEEEYEDEDDEQPQASSSRSHHQSQDSGGRREKVVRKHMRRVVCKPSREARTDELRTPRARSQSRRRRGIHTSDNGDESHRRPKRVATSPLTPRPARRQPAPPDEDEEELNGSDRFRTPSPVPSPGRLRRKHSAFTMPGALFDRTSSLEPTPEPQWERTRVVRFASDVSSSPSHKQSETPRRSYRNQEMEVGPSSGHSIPSSSDRRARSPCDVGSSSEDEEGTPSPPTRPRLRTSSSFVQEAIRRRSEEENPDISLLLPRSPMSAVWSSPNKGKGKAPASPEIINVDDSDEESSSGEDRNRTSQANMSVTTRMKGKERELHTARQQEKERETQSNANNEERARDKERIRALEEELKKLREELAKRPVATQPYFVPPPPPPPPPPPAASSRSQASHPSSSFADVRASLRHTAAPIEKPINPAAYGGTSKRKGQPTINVGADMMAAFLTEMKTHRLRKVGAVPEGSSAGPAPHSQPAVRVREVGDVGNRSEVMLRPREIEDIGNRSEVLPRPGVSFAVPAPKQGRRADSVTARNESEASETEVGSKRKYSEASYEESQESLPSKRRALVSSTSDSSGHSSMSIPSSSTRNSKLSLSTTLVNQSNSALAFAQSHPPPSDSSSNSRLLSGTRTETEMTTPSLCSDNEQENGSYEGRSPPTPPLPASMGMQSSSVSSGEGVSQKAPPPPSRHAVEEVEEVDIERYRSEQHHDRSRSVSRIHEIMQTTDTFARRPPASPRLVDSPRRPRPPARPRLIKEIAQPEEGDDEDEDPLSLSYTAADAQVEEEEEEEHGQATGAPDSPPLRLPIRPPPGTFKLVKQRAIPPTRLPMRQASQKSKMSRSSARGSSNTSSSASALRRRDSLDSELRRAEEAYEADVLINDVQLESGTFAGRGTRSRKYGFLAHGGAGGHPVVMGSGYVDGLEEMEDSEEEPVPPSRRAMRPSSTRRV